MYLQWHSGCCEPVLQSNTEQWGLHVALKRAAMHWCWVTAHLCEQHISIGVTAVAQGCFQPVLQSSTEQWGLHVALNRAAVHWCWVTALMSEGHISIGSFAVTQWLL